MPSFAAAKQAANTEIEIEYENETEIEYEIEYILGFLERFTLHKEEDRGDSKIPLDK